MKTKNIIFGFLALILPLVFLQLHFFRYFVPGPDTVEYMEMAALIGKIGYVQALSGHWSPLFPLYLFWAEKVLGFLATSEVGLALVSNIFIHLFSWATSVLLLNTLANFFIQKKILTKKFKAVWMVYGLSISFFLLFGFCKIHLLMPDVLVFGFATLCLWAWAKVFFGESKFGYAFLAGIFAGLGYLARSSILPWSIGVGLVATFFYPERRTKQKILLFIIMIFGLSVVAIPQMMAISKQKGFFTFGGGQTPFAEIYGAQWEKGAPAWPIHYLDGDLRIYKEERALNFPGFYEPGRQYEDAIIPFSLSAALRGVARAVQSLCFGFWSPNFALFWPIAWAFFPFAIFISKFNPSEKNLVQQSLARLLVLSGAGGILMHLLSFCAGFYLLPYLFLIFTGLLVFSSQSLSKEFSRSLYVAAFGFIILTVLLTASLYRDASLKPARAEFVRTQKLAQALSQIPSTDEKLRRIAVVGDWVGLYAVRLSNSQVYADIPNVAVLSNQKKFERIIQKLSLENVKAVLAPTNVVRGFKNFKWNLIEGTDFSLLTLTE